MKKQLKRSYWDIDSNFNFYFEDFKNDPIFDLEKLNFKKIKNKIYIYKNKKILLLNVVTSGTGGNGYIGSVLRGLIPGKSYKEKIDFVLCFHEKTKLFFLFESSVITKIENVSSLSINFWYFFYFKKFNEFKYLYESKKSHINDRRGYLWVFKYKELLLDLIQNKNIKFKELDEEKKKIIINDTKKRISSLKKIKKEDIEEIEENYNKYKNNPDDEIKKKYSKVIRRNCQDGWRRQLLLIYENKCLITNWNLTSILEACHIKSFKDIETFKEERDLRNGIIMTPTLHKLFDKGFFAFDENFQIIYSKELKGKNKELLQSSIKNKENYSEILKKNVDIKYINFHRKNIFRK